MNSYNRLLRSIAVVIRTLKATFPGDYSQRCMYFAFGIQRLLNQQNIKVNIICGDFLAFVVSREDKRSGLQGYGFGCDEEYSHYWIETEEHMVDVGPHFLPETSSYPVAKMPIIVWRKSNPLPIFLRYKPLLRLEDGAYLDAPIEIQTRMREFLEECIRRLDGTRGQPKLPSWVLRDGNSLKSMAKKRDVWSRSAIRFSEETREEELPF